MVQRRAVAGSATYRQVMTCPFRPARPRSSPLTVMRTAPASPTRTSTASVALSVISPPAGTYFQTQRVDLLVAVPDPGRAVAASIRVDALDVTGLFFACAAFGRSGADATLRCPGVPVSILAPGAHTWTVRIDFNDGTNVVQSVRWIVRPATEP